MGGLPEVSVVIPTYNRLAFLRDTLTSLAQQTFPAERFEVIVVDDGSMDETKSITAERYPFAFQYVRQANQGDAEARNTGARASQADVLVFLDDDILVEPDYLAAIVAAHRAVEDGIIVGTEVLWLEESNPLLELRNDARQAGGEGELVPIPFVDVCSNNMSVKRRAYLSIGMMHSLDFPGSSMWCDVDFTYRAHLKGFSFLRSPRGVCWHRDYVSRNLDNQKKRWREAGYRAVTLFEKYPDLIQFLPMFADKTPVDWSRDSAVLILRKWARRIASSQAIIGLIERWERVVAQGNSRNALSERLQRWIIGGCIFQGYREGLRNLPVGPAQFSSGKID